MDGTSMYLRPFQKRMLAADRTIVKLRDYQLEVLEPLRERFVYGDAPGSGKTPTTLEWLRRTGAQSSLIVAPLPVLHHWPDQAELWTPELEIAIAHGPKRRAVYEAYGGVEGLTRPSALVVNYETMRGDADVLLKLRAWDAVIFDEAHRLKNRRALVHKAAVKFARRAGLMVAVTGTPILNRAEEAWSLFHLLDPKRYISFWRWAHEHFFVWQRNVGGRWIPEIGDPKPGAEDAIRRDLGLALVKRPLELLLPEMPPVTETVLEIDLSPAERRAYDAMRKRAWTEIEGNVLMASNQVAKMTRLRQLSSDWSAFLEEQPQPGSKVKATLELIDDLEPEQVVVFTAYKSTAQRLAELLGSRATVFDGDMEAVARNTAIRRFVNCDVQVIVGTFGAMREGVDGLQVARHMILLDREWTPAANEQAIGRIRRSGQRASAITVTHVVARDTMDEVVAKALQRKEEVIEAIVGARA